jgi:hypothetical protein
LTRLKIIEVQAEKKEKDAVLTEKKTLRKCGSMEVWWCEVE